MATDGGKTFLDDQQSLRALVALMPRGEREEYDTYGCLSLESVFPNRVMVVYTLRGGKPTDTQVISFGDLSVDRINGPACTVDLSQKDKLGRSQIALGVIPKRLPGRDVYMHIPQNFILKWKGKKMPGGAVHFVPHYAVLVKSASKETHQVEGDTYCVRLNNFRERFPDTDLRY